MMLLITVLLLTTQALANAATVLVLPVPGPASPLVTLLPMYLHHGSTTLWLLQTLGPGQCNIGQNRVVCAAAARAHQGCQRAGSTGHKRSGKHQMCTPLSHLELGPCIIIIWSSWVALRPVWCAVAGS